MHVYNMDMDVYNYIYYISVKAPQIYSFARLSLGDNNQKQQQNRRSFNTTPL